MGAAVLADLEDVKVPKNGEDYVLTFGGAYESRQAELTNYVEQIFTRMPEMAEKVLAAKELHGLVPRIYISDDNDAISYGEATEPNMQRSGDVSEDGIVLFKDDAGALYESGINLYLNSYENLGVYDDSCGCVKNDTLVTRLARGLTLLSDPEYKQGFDEYHVRYEDYDNYVNGSNSLMGPNPDIVAELEADLIEFYNGMCLRAEERASQFEDHIARVYGKEAGIPEQGSLSNSYFRDRFNLSTFTNSANDAIDEARRLVTGHHAVRLDVEASSTQADSEKLPENAKWCSDEQQPDLLWKMK